MTRKVHRKKLDIKDPDSETQMFPIGVLSEILNTTERILRTYQDKGILVPAGKAGQPKFYSLNDIKKAKFIQFLSNERGLNLAGIKILFQVLDKFGVSTDKYMELIDELETKSVR